MAGAESCIGGPELGRAVDARLGRNALVPLGSAEIVVHGRIERFRDETRVMVDVEDAAGKHLGTRELVRVTPRCRELDDDLALIVALTIDPEAIAAKPSEQTGRPGPSVGPTLILQRERVEVPGAPTASSTSSPSPPPPPQLRYAVEGGATVMTGVLPGTAFGGRARVGVSPRLPGFVELAATVLGERDTRAPAGPTGARLGLAFGTLTACPEPFRTAALSAAICVGASVGAYQVTGFGLDETRTDDRLYADGNLSGRARARIWGPLYASLGAGLALPFVRDTFGFVDTSGERQRLFRASVVSTQAELGLGLAFPP